MPRNQKSFLYTCVVLALVAATATATAYSQPGPKRQETIIGFDPVAYWPLDEKRTDRVVRDRTNNHQDGLFEGVNAGAPGSLPRGRAVFFGTPGINLTDTTVAIHGNAARSIVAWIKTTEKGLQAIVATGFPADNQAFNVVMYSGCGTVGVMGYNNDFYPCGGNTGIDSADGGWHMLAVVYRASGNLRIYADGSLDNTSFMTYDTNGQENYIGRSNHANCGSVSCAYPFRGSIDDVAIFDYALTGKQIALLANSNK